MKTQIAIIAGGLAIAAGVAYAELSPKTQSIPNNAVQPTASQSQQSSLSAPSQTNIQPRQNTKSTPSNKQQRLTNPNTQPQLPSGGGEGEGREGGEGGFFGGGDD